MYHTFFHLAEEPFGVSPDPRFYFESAQHAEAAASILYGISQRRGFSALIAAPGLGKTTVIVSLLQQLQERHDVVLLVHPELAVEALLESILQGLGITPDQDHAKRIQQLTRHLADLDRRGRSCVIILDEAQNLSPQALESVRMLSNFETTQHKLLQFVLVGQPALATLLQKPECEQLRQRVNIIARLQPLAEADVITYIKHRLVVAGAVQNPFSDGGLKAIAVASAGIPRIVNTLCFNSLTLAFADSARIVTAAHIAEAVADLELYQVVIPKRVVIDTSEVSPLHAVGTPSEAAPPSTPEVSGAEFQPPLQPTQPESRWSARPIEARPRHGFTHVLSRVLASVGLAKLLLLILMPAAPSFSLTEPTFIANAISPQGPIRS